MTLEQAARRGGRGRRVRWAVRRLGGRAGQLGAAVGHPAARQSAQAGAARLVYQLTGYLVDGTSVLRAQGSAGADARPAVVCQLLSQAPSAEARRHPEQIRWYSFAEALDAGLPKPCGTTWWAIHPCRDGAAYVHPAVGGIPSPLVPARRAATKHYRCGL